MRDALRLMAKVFAIVFGAGLAVVVLGYLVLGGLYIYKRIETPKPIDYDALVKKYGGVPVTSTTAIPLYEKGSAPDYIPPAQLDCQHKYLAFDGSGATCVVEIEGKMAAFIDAQTAKDNLASAKDDAPLTIIKSEPLPCPASDPLGLYTKSKCTPRPGK